MLTWLQSLKHSDSARVVLGSSCESCLASGQVSGREMLPVDIRSSLSPSWALWSDV